MKEKKYLKLYYEIKNKILKGNLKPGEKILSKRVMADKSGCSVITVEKAYEMLIEEGYIDAKEKSGYYVSKLDIPKRTEDTLNEEKINLLNENVNCNIANDFEYSLWFKTIRKVISEKKERLFIKSPNKGCEILRNEIAEYLYRYRGMIAQPDRIIIGSGAEQLYEIVIKLLGRDKIYGIEEPSYSQIEAVYMSEGARVSKLKMGNDGIMDGILENSHIDVLHVTPFKSFPTNVTTSLSKKYEYLKWSDGKKYIVEDDFNSEFFIPGQPVETLYSLDTKKKVIYINTFSKSLSSSIRMGYMILPDELVDIYDERMGIFSCSVPVLDQYVLSEFISSGNFERHLNRMRRRMSDKL